MKKTLIVVLIIVLVIHIFLELVFRHIVPYAMVQPGISPSLIGKEEMDDNFQSFTVAANDSIQLSGFMIAPENDIARSAIILLHGIGGNKSHFYETAQILAAEGHLAVATDLRAHGESGGKFISYGYYERHDIVAVVDYIKAKYPDIKIGIWGGSLGGAIALQAMEIDDRIDFGIVESTFRDLEEIMHDYQRRIVRLPLGYYTDKAIRKAEQLANFQVSDVAPVKSAANIQQPVLMAHGDADVHISFEYGRAIYDQLPNAQKQWILVEGGEHHGMAAIGGKAYTDQLFAFIERHSQ